MNTAESIAKPTVRRITEPNSCNDYTVGWICALPKEQTAAKAMLDELHAAVQKPPGDPNNYSLGSIGGHNIVIAGLPKGQTSNYSAATVAAWMVSTFPCIKFGLLVGIGGGIPPKVRLGDVVVSTPIGEFPGVVQYDIGREEAYGFRRTGSLNNPPSLLLTALTNLESDHEMDEPKMLKYLEELREKWPKLASKYLRSKSMKDILFQTRSNHVEVESKGGENRGDGDEYCKHCESEKIVGREPREARVHYGLIASGNKVIKDGNVRTGINELLGNQALCVEMEAAGLMNNFPCLVIRGISDYADSHKNDSWQEHAAAMAAAYTKELLQYVQPADVARQPSAKETMKES